MTVLDLITDALTSIGELGQSEVPAPEDASYCLLRLNGLLDTWQLDRLLVVSISIAPYNITATKGSYVIGQTGSVDFNAPRPINIESAAVIQSLSGGGSTRHPIDLISEQEYTAMSDLGAASNTPLKLYCDFNFPNATIYLWPVPSVAAQLELGTWNVISQFTATTQTISFPPGYYQAILWNLCVLISPGYDKQVDPVTAANAEEAKRRLMSLNMRRLPPAVQQQMAAMAQAQQPAQPQQQG